MCKVQYLQRCLKFLVLHKKYFKYLTKLTVRSFQEENKIKAEHTVQYECDVL